MVQIEQKMARTFRILKSISHGRPKNIHGKISYSLDLGDAFEVFRDFTKKSPKIYDDKSKDITQNYSFDKNKNSEFFIEQTGIAEEVLFKTAVIEQQEVTLDKARAAYFVAKNSE